MRRFLLAAIRFYQRYLSPYKGFCCAYRHHTGRASCSAFGYRAVRRYGALTGLALIRERTQLCGDVHAHYAVRPRALHGQRGVCDLGCDLPCDGSEASHCDLPCGGHHGHGVSRLGRCGDVCDCLDVCDCFGCDWPSRRRDAGKRRRDRQTRFVHVAPNAWRRRKD